MNLELTDDQRELAAVAKGLLDRHAPLSLARSELAGQGDPTTLWNVIAAAGWYLVGIEEDDPFGSAWALPTGARMRSACRTQLVDRHGGCATSDGGRRGRQRDARPTEVR